MKYLIASDIHGSAYWTERLCSAIESEQPDRIVLLGDLLYHGPRNDLPRDYAPKRVIPLLNALADRIIAVRGNCDAEVDQMVLDFHVMADYATLFDEAGRELFLTHGHVFGAGMHNSVDHAPALPEGSALVYGHTHIKVNEASEAHPGLWLFNPGSVSIPKDGTHSYGIYEGGAFRGLARSVHAGRRVGRAAASGADHLASSSARWLPVGPRADASEHRQEHDRGSLRGARLH